MSIGAISRVRKWRVEVKKNMKYITTLAGTAILKTRGAVRFRRVALTFSRSTLTGRCIALDR
jgi:hypothetical protein